MRRTALSIAVLVGITALAVKADATPAFSATVVLERSTVLVTDRSKGWHRGSRHGFGPHRHWGATKHRYRPNHGHRAFATGRIHRAPVVIVRPAWRHAFGYRHVAPRPLIKNGSFSWRRYRW